MCQAVDVAAQAVGFTTSYSSAARPTGLEIYAELERNDARNVVVNSLNVTLDVQDF